MYVEIRERSSLSFGSHAMRVSGLLTGGLGSRLRVVMVVFILFYNCMCPLVPARDRWTRRRSRTHNASSPRRRSRPSLRSPPSPWATSSNGRVPSSARVSKQATVESRPPLFFWFPSCCSSACARTARRTFTRCTLTRRTRWVQLDPHGS